MRRPLEDLVAAGDFDTVGHVLVLADAEARLRDHWSDWKAESKRRYLDRLQAAGYELSEAERRKLAQADTEASEDLDDRDDEDDEDLPVNDEDLDAEDA